MLHYTGILVSRNDKVCSTFKYKSIILYKEMIIKKVLEKVFDYYAMNLH